MKQSTRLPVLILATLGFTNLQCSCTLLDPAPSACIDEIRTYELITENLLSTRFECRDNIAKDQCLPELFKVGQVETVRIWNDQGSCRDLGYNPVN
ncbi:MAG: hypothetical protein KDK41_09985 [Leptospiraceae bacterium]|nr:hypothetical protein [Leptospiraceae bacterium]MCB1200963.1 hypothetical protein [Leptospiraceae bacterium]